MEAEEDRLNAFEMCGATKRWSRRAMASEMFLRKSHRNDLLPLLSTLLSAFLLRFFLHIFIDSRSVWGGWLVGWLG